MNVIAHHKIFLNRVDNSKHTNDGRLSYPQLKKQLCSNTMKTGAVLSAYYFINEGLDKGLSMTIGATASSLYMYLLCNYVDKINEKPSNYQLFVPIGANVLEYIINTSQDTVHLDYLVTFGGFISYKIALLYVLLDEIVMMLNDDLIEYKENSTIKTEIEEVVEEIKNGGK